LVFCLFHRSQPFNIGLEFGMQFYLDPLLYLNFWLSGILFE